MKGIGILCVMIGHTTWIPGWLDRIVYSFHIPLFFIVAGLFSKTYDEVKENKIEYIKHLAHRLLVPYVLVMIAVCVGAGVQALKYDQPQLLTHNVVRYLFALDYCYPDTLFDLWVSAVWFLPALFWSKVFFLFITQSKQWGHMICIVLAVAMILLHPYVVTPLCIGRGVEGLFFIVCGWWFRHNSMPWWGIVLCVCFWVVSMLLGKIDLCAFQFNCLLIDLIGSIGGTMVVYFISLFLSKIKGICLVLSWMGMHSMGILCLHTIESSIPVIHVLVGFLSFGLSAFVYFGLKHLATIVSVAILSKVPIVKKYL